MFRLIVICGCLLAVAQAGVIGGGLIAATAPAASLTLQPTTLALQPIVATSSSNIIRGIGNLGTISAYSGSEDSSFSSVRKADVRVNNPGVTRIVTAATAPALAVANTALAAPLTTAAISAPALSTAIAAGPTYGLGLGTTLGTGIGLGSGIGLGAGLGLGHVKVL